MHGLFQGKRIDTSLWRRPNVWNSGFTKKSPCGQEPKRYVGGIPEKWCRQDLVAGASKDQEDTSSGIIISRHIFISICARAFDGCSVLGRDVKCSWGAFLADVGAGSCVFAAPFLLFWGSRNPDHLRRGYNRIHLRSISRRIPAAPARYQKMLMDSPLWVRVTACW